LQKENANFCDFFSPRAGAFERKTASRSGSARDELDALFGKEGPGEDIVDGSDPSSADQPQDPEDAARKKLDDLFG
jgi:hypothetical protein